MSTIPEQPPVDNAHVAPGCQLFKPRKFYWSQCYEIGDSVHWALCDSESNKQAKERGIGCGQVTCVYMVLFADYPRCMDGQPLGKQPMPELIVKLLNEHFSKQQ